MITIKLLDKELTLEEVKEIYYELDKLFGKKEIIYPRPTNPYKPNPSPMGPYNDYFITC